MTFVFLRLNYKATLSDGNTNLWWGVIKHKQYKRVIVEFPSTTNITPMLVQCVCLYELWSVDALMLCYLSDLSDGCLVIVVNYSTEIKWLRSLSFVFVFSTHSRTLSDYENKRYAYVSITHKGSS